MTEVVENVDQQESQGPSRRQDGCGIYPCNDFVVDSDQYAAAVVCKLLILFPFRNRGAGYAVLVNVRFSAMRMALFVRTKIRKEFLRYNEKYDKILKHMSIHCMENR